MATKSAIISEINTNFPDNTSGLITPSLQRTTHIDEVNSWQQAPLVNSQTGTTYTIAAADYGQMVLLTNASPVAVTLPAASGPGFFPFNVLVKNNGTGLVTITVTAGAIDGAATLQLSTKQAAWLVSDGTNWFTGAFSLSPGGAPAPINASYLTLGLDPTLTAERVLTAGNGVNFVDGGANSTLTVHVSPVNEAADTTCFPAFFTAPTGNLAPSTNASLIFNALTGALGATTLELGGATDTTLSRVSAGVLAIEGVNILTTATGIASTRQVNSGGGLTGGGALSTDLTLAVGAGTGIVVNPDDVAIDTTVVARKTDNLSVFAATTSSQLAGVISDETGSGLLVFATSPILTTPQINDSAANNRYVFAVADLAADRTISLPLLTANDTFVFQAFAQTLTNKTIALGSNTVSGSVTDFNNALTGADFYTTGGTDVALADGGTGASLTAPSIDRLLMWDQGTSQIAFGTLANISTQASPTTGDFVLIQKGGTDDLQKVDWSTLPGAAGGTLAFGTVRVTGQSDVVASAAPDILTLAAGTNVTITTVAGTKTVTINASGGGVTDGDKGDIVVSSGGTVWTINVGVVSNAKLRDSAGLSVIGRSVNSTGVPGDIATSPNNNAVLRENGSGVIGWGTIATPGIGDAQVTYAKIQNVTSSRFLGRVTAGAGVIEELTGTQATGLLDQFSTVTTAKGVVPGSNGASTSNFLRADGTWAIPAGGSGSPGGTSGQVQYNNAGAFGGFDVGGDATLVTSTGVLTIAAQAVTYAKIQNVTATDRVLGRASAGAGVVEEITCTQQGRDLLDDTSTAAQRTTLGLQAGATATAATASDILVGTASSMFLNPVNTLAALAAVALTDAATIAVDLATGVFFTLTLTGNHTLGNPTNTKIGRTIYIRVAQDATGSRTLAYGANYDFGQDTAPTLTTTGSAQDLLAFFVSTATRILYLGIRKNIG